MVKRILALIVGMGLLACPGLALAGETDLLIQKLVEKNILTPYEAQILLDDIKQDVNKQNAKAENEMLPKWIQTTKLKGDLRLRYQTEQREAGTTRNRGRIRYRLGLETKPSDKFMVGAGFASGSTDSRSTNQTFENTFQTGDIRLDYAWGEYKPNSNLSLIGGKYNAQGKGYLWHTTDMLWDSDIQQEGVSALFNYGNAFLSSGYWVLDESSSSSSDTGMYYAQAGMTLNPAEAVKLKLAGTFYGVHGLEETNTLLDNRPSTSNLPAHAGNTVSGTKYVYDWDQIWAGSAEMVYSWPEETSFPIKMAGVFGDYVINPDPDSQNTGWATGLKFGHKKVGAAKGDWQFKYQYVSLGKDAWLDSFPDSDRYAGATNIKGHELILGIGLAKNVSLDFDYYRSDIAKGDNRDEQIFQVDINMKF